MASTLLSSRVLAPWGKTATAENFPRPNQAVTKKNHPPEEPEMDINSINSINRLLGLKNRVREPLNGLEVYLCAFGSPRSSKRETP